MISSVLVQARRSTRTQRSGNDSWEHRFLRMCTICIYIVINKLLESTLKQFYSCLVLYLEEEMATYSSVLAWKILQTEEPGRLQSMGLQRIGHD